MDFSLILRFKIILSAQCRCLHHLSKLTRESKFMGACGQPDPTPPCTYGIQLYFGLRESCGRAVGVPVDFPCCMIFHELLRCCSTLALKDLKLLSCSVVIFS